MWKGDGEKTNNGHDTSVKKKERQDESNEGAALSTFFLYCFSDVADRENTLLLLLRRSSLLCLSSQLLVLFLRVAYVLAYGLALC